MRYSHLSSSEIGGFLLAKSRTEGLASDSTRRGACRGRLRQISARPIGSAGRLIKRSACVSVVATFYHRQSRRAGHSLEKIPWMLLQRCPPLLLAEEPHADQSAPAASLGNASPLATPILLPPRLRGNVPTTHPPTALRQSRPSHRLTRTGHSQLFALGRASLPRICPNPFADLHHRINQNLKILSLASVIGNRGAQRKLPLKHGA